MKTKHLVLYSLISLLTFYTVAQPVVGMWQVDKVNVGDEEMTPVAKWFKNNKDHTYQAGNGWMQNDLGTWTYDKKTKEFTPEGRGGSDGYGPFKVAASGDKMTWERMEDGMKVVVSLSKVDAMPMSPKDSIVGKWGLTSVVKKEGGETPADQVGKESIFIRWTGTFRQTNADGSKSYGYWHMDPHKPEFHLINYNREIPTQVYVIGFKDNQVTMVLKDDNEIMKTYTKR